MTSPARAPRRRAGRSAQLPSGSDAERPGRDPNELSLGLVGAELRSGQDVGRKNSLGKLVESLEVAPTRDRHPAHAEEVLERDLGVLPVPHPPGRRIGVRIGRTASGAVGTGVASRDRAPLDDLGEHVIDQARAAPCSRGACRRPPPTAPRDPDPTGRPRLDAPPPASSAVATSSCSRVAGGRPPAARGRDRVTGTRPPVRARTPLVAVMPRRGQPAAPVAEAGRREPSAGRSGTEPARAGGGARARGPPAPRVGARRVDVRQPRRGARSLPVRRRRRSEDDARDLARLRRLGAVAVGVEDADSAGPVRPASSTSRSTG
jgi:hypothetical protein